MNDPVENPQHYKQGKIEVLTFILDQNLPWCAANVIKYVCRYRWKGRPVEDLKKARFYLDRQIAMLEEREPQTRPVDRRVSSRRSSDIGGQKPRK